MERNEVTTVSELKVGDRFYLKGSSSRKAYEMIGPLSYGKFEVCPADKMVNGTPINKSRIEVVKANTGVVYLRNVNN